MLSNKLEKCKEIQKGGAYHGPVEHINSQDMSVQEGSSRNGDSLIGDRPWGEVGGLGWGYNGLGGENLVQFRAVSLAIHP